MSEQSPRRLQRSSSDRMLAGVCGGLGEYFSVDPLILRIALAVSVFFGGLGVVLYLALALLVPVDDAPDGRPLVSMSRSQGVTIAIAFAALVIAIPVLGVLFAWIGDPGVLWLGAVVVLVVAGLTAWRDRDRRGEGEQGGTATTAARPAVRQPDAGNAPGSEAPTQALPAPSARGRSPLVTVVLVCGIALLSIAAFFAAALMAGFGLGVLVAATIVAGGMATVALAFASGAGARWLIAPLAALVIGVGAAEAADLDLKGGIGDESHRPASAALIPAEGYRLGLGNLSVDLRDMRWPAGRAVPLRAEAGVGYVEVRVPPDVCVVGRASSRAGYVTLAGEEDQGFEAEAASDLRSRAGDPGARKASRRGAGPHRGPVLEVGAAVDYGAVQVLNDGSASSWDEHRGPIPADSLAEMRRLNERACSR